MAFAGMGQGASLGCCLRFNFFHEGFSCGDGCPAGVWEALCSAVPSGFHRNSYSREFPVAVAACLAFGFVLGLSWVSHGDGDCTVG